MTDRDEVLNAKYPVRFFLEFEWPLWKVRSEYPDGIARDVTCHLSHRSAVLVSQALTQQFRNGWDMALKRQVRP